MLVCRHHGLHDQPLFVHEFAVVDIVECAQAKTDTPQFVASIVATLSDTQVVLGEQRRTMRFEDVVERVAVGGAEQVAAGLGQFGHECRRRHALPDNVLAIFTKFALYGLLDSTDQLDAIEEAELITRLAALLLVGLLQHLQRWTLHVLRNTDHQLHGDQSAHVRFEPLVIANDLGIFVEQFEQLNRSVEPRQSDRQENRRSRGIRRVRRGACER